MSSSVPGVHAPLRACAVAARLLVLSVAAPAAFAQGAAPTIPPEDPIVITASRLEERLSQTLGDVSLIDRAAIERSGASNVGDLLVRVPGIEVVRNGGPGSSTSIGIRGGETRHVAVYVDGVRVDSQSIGGATWEAIPVERLERVEVLRGPAAAVYGSDAVGGVVQVFTRRGRDGLRADGGIGVGSQGTRTGDAGVSGASGALDYALSAAWGRSDGFDATTASNPDEDGWRRGSVQARAGWQFTPDHRVEATFVESHLHSQYDGYTSGLDDRNAHELRTAGLSWRGRWSENATTTARLSESQNSYETRPSYYRTETRLRDALVQHEQTVLPGQRVSVTLERREDDLQNPAAGGGAALEGERSQNGVAIGWRGDFGTQSLQFQVRRDDDSEFGGENTGSVAWGWAFAPAWRVTASAGTSFRAPTLYQRYSRYGNPDLVPEKGRDVEVGARWAARGSEAALTVWRNKVSELIDWQPTGTCVSMREDGDWGGCYANVGRARIQGLTLSGRTALGAVALRGSLDIHDPENAETGRDLARRARRFATFGADTVVAGWRLGADWRLSSGRYDDPDNTARLGGYGLVDLNAERRLTPNLKLQARVDNVGGKDYEQAGGYNTAGRTAQLALRWSL